MTKPKIQTYNLMDLHVLKAYVRPDSLKFFTEVWRNLGTLEPLNIHDPMNVGDIEGKIKLVRHGLQRAIWYAINNHHTIKALEYYTEQGPEDPDIDRVVEVVTNLSKEKFPKIYELASMVENLSNYHEEGEPSIRITLDDLIKGKRIEIPA